MEVKEMENMLIEYAGVGEQFIDGAVCVGGYNKETMERVLFYHTGYGSFEAWAYFELDPLED